MTFGESFGAIVLKVSIMFHHALAGYVGVTNATQSDGGSQLQYTTLTSGMNLAEWLAAMSEIYVGVLGATARIAGLGANLAKLVTVLLS